MGRLIERAALELGGGRVDLWWLDLGAPPDEEGGSAADLSEEERERARSFGSADTRERFLAARLALRRILSGYVAISPRELPLVRNAFGKPSLPGGPEFNLSHAERVAVLAVAPSAVGVDVERVRPIPAADRLAERWFDEAELRAWGAERRDARDVAFLRRWTRREAFVKAIGTGLAGLARYPTLDEGRWEIHELRCPPGHVAALAVERR